VLPLGEVSLRSLRPITSPACNALLLTARHLPEPLSPAAARAAFSPLEPFEVDAIIPAPSASDPFALQATRRVLQECLLSAVPRPRAKGEAAVARLEETLAALADDAAELTVAYSALLGCPGVHAVIEYISHQPCSRWHADYLTVRAIVTYAGVGTEFCDNADVERCRVTATTGQFRLLPGAVVRSAGPGDVLLLKGHAYEGVEGLGVVHRSPAVPKDAEGRPQTRLLLKLDPYYGVLPK
jgi:hypothetical protein